MSVEDPDKIDFIGVEAATGKVVLTISDHLDWEPLQPHLVALQGKLNTYLDFVESGELQETYPDAQGRAVVFEVVTRVMPIEDAKPFLESVQHAIEETGVEFRVRQSD